MKPLHEGLLRFPLAWAAALGIAGYSVGAAWLIGPESAWVQLRPLWGRTVLKLAGVDVQVMGSEHLVGPALFVSNHPGYMDAVLPAALMPPKTKWLMKGEFAQVPVLGRAVKGGAVFVDRKSSAKAREALESAANTLPDGWSLLIFPEGTRQRDGHLGAFKKGVFHLALATGLPIVPIASFGSNRVVPPGGVVVRPGRIDVDVGAPIATAGWHADELEQRLVDVRAAVQRCAHAAQARWEAAA